MCVFQQQRSFQNWFCNWHLCQVYLFKCFSLSMPTRNKNYQMNVFHCFFYLQKIRFKIVSFRRMNWLWQFYYNVVPIPYAQKKNCLYLVSKHFLHTQIQFLKGWVDLRGTHMSRCKNPSMWWRYQNHFKF